MEELLRDPGSERDIFHRLPRQCRIKARDILSSRRIPCRMTLPRSIRPAYTRPTAGNFDGTCPRSSFDHRDLGGNDMKLYCSSAPPARHDQGLITVCIHEDGCPVASHIRQHQTLQCASLTPEKMPVRDMLRSLSRHPRTLSRERVGNMPRLNRPATCLPNLNRRR